MDRELCLHVISTLFGSTVLGPKPGPLEHEAALKASPPEFQVFNPGNPQTLPFYGVRLTEKPVREQSALNSINLSSPPKSVSRNFYVVRRIRLVCPRYFTFILFRLYHLCLKNRLHVRLQDGQHANLASLLLLCKASSQLPTCLPLRSQYRNCTKFAAR